MITMVTTKDDDKSDEQKAQVNQRTSISRESRTSQEFKNQDSRSQESRSRFKTQDSRMKKRLNQDKY